MYNYNVQLYSSSCTRKKEWCYCVQDMTENELADCAASFFQGCGGHEAAQANLLLLCCLFYLHLFLVSVVGGDCLSYHS